MTMAGRPKRSFRRLATIPITPGMPAAAGDQDQRAVGLGLGGLAGLLGDQHLDRPPLFVQAVELGGDGPRFLGIG